ncbi:DUF2264 domain-containing protein [Paenibacillus sp. MMS18-CY102]|uniref:DUF2264 domain-containing protein n=1 Tax=Paenibacillus sp. MMS18-CY102 TaxID=2682849 RepID=UPI0013652C2B|nr:DUF2264 domain-containing protein [Paenibacillus sp. MMS18-CY102]MWC27884.1 DUF2264 domain-containing protein [Paenibacillus sp. MMS18-CY102]
MTKTIEANELRTKRDAQQALLRLCDPLRPYYSEGRAGLHLADTGAKYEDGIARMEAFARPLWGLVPLAAGGGETDLWDAYAEGFRNGTNPAHAEYWGTTGDTDQRFVEMAAIGLALLLTPDRIWAPLDEQERTQLAAWLDQINRHDMPQNNWRFFIVLVNLGLKKVGAPYGEAAMNQALAFIDECYLGDGWYADGKTEQRDYYIAFAMHYYALVYAGVMAGEDPERCKRFKERARLFAQDFIYWFAEDGSALPFGRSLTYRFAQSAFWGALAFAGVEAFEWGVIKGLALRNLDWWLKQPIYTKEGLLTIGYAYPNMHMAEEYNAQGSPYWALKAFLPLALDDGHPFWTAEAKPLPKLNARAVQPHPHMAVCRKDGHVAAFTAGQYAAFEPVAASAKYEKFAYSNLFGFSVSNGGLGLAQGAFDSMLAFSEEDDYYRGRRQCEAYRVEEQAIYARWRAWRDVEVETWLLPGLPWHVRVHRVRTGRGLFAAEGGFAIPRAELRPALAGEGEELGRDRIMLKQSGLASGIVNLLGEREALNIEAMPNTNLLHRRTGIPTLKGYLPPGEHWLAAAVFGGKMAEMAAEDGWVNLPSVLVKPDSIVIQYGDDSGSGRSSWSIAIGT